MAAQDGSSSLRLPTGPGVPLGLVALAVLIYSFSGSPASSPPQSKDGQKTSEDDKTAVTEDNPLKPLYEFLDAENGSADNASGPCGEWAPYDVEFVIATVPDPIDSHLAPSFDRAVDAIERGFQSTRLTLDRTSIPWKRDSTSKWELSLLGKGPVAVTAKSSSNDSFRKTPGTLLFRGSPDLSRLLVVFLVGEVPTWGIQRQAMTRALTAIEESEERGARQRCLTPGYRAIQILGPYFSGSTPSLDDTLSAWNRYKGRPVSIISGSATVGSNDKTLSAGSVSFRATVIPDRTLTRQFNRFLRERLGASEWNTALFVEGGTSYGSANVAFHGSRDDDAQDDELPELKRPGFTIDFPLHVAQLRAAYEKDAALRNPGTQTRNPRHSLELALETSEQPSRDVIPPQNSTAAANTADLTLGDSIEAIRREHIRFVGIIGSDPRDILFLARRIREAGSDATLFTYGADVLFTHADYFRYLHGMLVVTPYPILPGNQAVTRNAWRRVSFAGSSEEGIYNAARYFGGRRAWLLDYRVPSPGFENWSPSRPPIWIMAVGREGFWPVDVNSDYSWFDTKESQFARSYVLSTDPLPPPRRRDPPPGERRKRAPELSGVPTPAPTPNPGERRPEPRVARPPGGVLGLELTELILALLALVYWVGRRDERFWLVPCPEPGKEPAVSILGVGAYVPESVRKFMTVWDPKEDECRINRINVGMLAFIASSIQAAILISLLAIQPFLQPPEYTVPILFVIGFVNVVALFAAALCEAEAIAAETRGRIIAKQPWWARVRPLAVLAPVLAFVVALLISSYSVGLNGRSQPQVLSFYARAFDLTSAVSPVVPLALTLIVLMAWPLCNLDRAYLMRLRGSKFEELKGISGLHEAEDGVRSVIADGRTRSLLLLGALVILIPFYEVVADPIDAIDGSVWGAVLKTLLLICAVLVAYAVITFLALWLRLRDVLQRIASHPLLTAFQRLPESMSATPWRMWKADPSLASAQASIAHLRLLSNLKPRGVSSKFWTDLETSADAAERHLDGAFRVVHRGFIATLDCQRQLKDVLEEVTKSLLHELGQHWKTWRGPADLDETPPPADAKKQPGPEEKPGHAGAEKKTKQLAPREPYMDMATWLARQTPSADELWVHVAEEYLAIRITSFIRYVFLQLRNLLSFALIAFVLTLLALSSYPFQPIRPFMALVWVIGIVSIVAVGVVLFSIERDRVLSYIGKTKPGEVTINREFVSTLMLYVAVPLLTLLATQFPGVGDVIYSIFTPAMKAGH